MSDPTKVHYVSDSTGFTIGLYCANPDEYMVCGACCGYHKDCDEMKS